MIETVGSSETPITTNTTASITAQKTTVWIIVPVVASVVGLDTKWSVKMNCVSAPYHKGVWGCGEIQHVLHTGRSTKQSTRSWLKTEKKNCS